MLGTVLLQGQFMHRYYTVWYYYNRLRCHQLVNNDQWLINNQCNNNVDRNPVKINLNINY